MALMNLYIRFETVRSQIVKLLRLIQFGSAKAHGKNNMKFRRTSLGPALFA